MSRHTHRTAPLLIALALLSAPAPLHAADIQASPKGSGGSVQVTANRVTRVVGNLSAGGGFAATTNYQLFGLMGWPALGTGTGSSYRIEAGLAFSAAPPILTLDPPALVEPLSGAMLHGVARLSAVPPAQSAPVTQMVFYADDVEIGHADAPTAGRWSLDWSTFATCERDGVTLTARSRGLTGAFSGGSNPVTVNLRNQTFSDVPCLHWARLFIESIAAAHIATGFPDGTFHSDETVTRAQMAVFLARSADLSLHNLASFAPLACGQESFGDLTCTYWAYRFIEYAFAKGLMAGFNGPPNAGGGNTLVFRPDQLVTRQAMALFLAKVRDLSDHDFAAFAPPACGSESFADVPCSNAAYKQIEYIASKGITVGFADGFFRPGQSVTRAQMSVFLVRASRLPL